MDQRQRLFRDVVEDVKSWVPPRDGKNFEQSLYGFLSERVNIGEDGVSRKEETIEVRKKTERPEIVVGEEIGLDIVKDFSEDDGQKFSKILDDSDLEFIVIVACGVEDVDAWKDFTVDKRGTHSIETQTDVVWKEKQFFGKTTY